MNVELINSISAQLRCSSLSVKQRIVVYTSTCIYIIGW